MHEYYTYINTCTVYNLNNFTNDNVINSLFARYLLMLIGIEICKFSISSKIIVFVFCNVIL